MNENLNKYGSVVIRKWTDGNGFSNYSYTFIDDGSLTPQENNTEVVAVFRAVNAIIYDKQIEKLCLSASDLNGRKSPIKESELIEKLSKTFYKPKCS